MKKSIFSEINNIFQFLMRIAKVISELIFHQIILYFKEGRRVGRVGVRVGKEIQLRLWKLVIYYMNEYRKKLTQEITGNVSFTLNTHPVSLDILDDITASGKQIRIPTAAKMYLIGYGNHGSNIYINTTA